MEDKDSDHDFWEKFDRNPELLPCSSDEFQQRFLNAKQERVRTLVPSFETQEKSKLVQVSLDAWEKDMILERMERIKQANLENLKNMKITVRSQTKNELRAAVIEIQKQFQLDVIKIKEDHEKMKGEISNKTQEVYNYSEYIIDQFYLIHNHQMKNPDFFKEGKNKTEKEISKVKQLLNIYKYQVDAVKEITAEYNKEAILAMMKVKEIDNEIQKINSSHQMDMQALRQKIGSQEEELISEKNQIEEELNSFRLKISQEIEIRNLLDKRQKMMIDKLKGEIRDTKIILQNPRMRIRLHEKIKEEKERSLNLPKILQGRASEASNRGDGGVEKEESAKKERKRVVRSSMDTFPLSVL